jgi:pimeloyl-ACP methyl ester carboxylesterase
LAPRPYSHVPFDDRIEKMKTTSKPKRYRLPNRFAHLCLAGIGAVALAAGCTPAAAQPSAGYSAAHNQYVIVDGMKLAYRSVGTNQAVPPLLLFQHFTGTMDDWDSTLINALAKHRRVIILGNPGVGASGGPAPDSVEGMARFAEGFVDALKLGRVDILGFSIGGSVAQLFVAERPELVRRLILVGAGPQGGEGIKNLQAVIADGFKRGGELQIDPKVPLFFTQTPNGLSEGKAFLKRIHDHTVDIEPPIGQAAMGAQAKALVTWGMSPTNAPQLKKITQPVLIVNGSNDLIIPTANSYVLYQHIPNAQLILYPDSGHGSLFQYHGRFAAEVEAFLGNG